jgi:hypothetical protein
MLDKTPQPTCNLPMLGTRWFLPLLLVIVVALLASSRNGHAQGSDEDIDNLTTELMSAQNQILAAFSSFEKAPESVFEKGAGVFASVPASVQQVKEKLANLRTIFKQRVEKRKADKLISEERRKKSLVLYQGKLDEATKLDDQCKLIVLRTGDFLSKDIPRLKNEFDIDCEDFGRAEAQSNLLNNLAKIQKDFEKKFIPDSFIQKKK